MSNHPVLNIKSVYISLWPANLSHQTASSIKHNVCVYTHTHTYMHMRVCVCVCVCEFSQDELSVRLHTNILKESTDRVWGETDSNFYHFQKEQQ